MPGQPAGAVDQPPAQNDASPHAGRDRQEGEVVGALPGANPRLGQGGGGGIVDGAGARAKEQRQFRPQGCGGNGAQRHRC